MPSQTLDRRDAIEVEYSQRAIFVQQQRLEDSVEQLFICAVALRLLLGRVAFRPPRAAQTTSSTRLTSPPH